MLMINQVYPVNKQVSLDGLYLGQNLAGIAAEIGRRVVLADFLVDQNEVVAKANPKGRFEIPAELKTLPIGSLHQRPNMNSVGWSLMSFTLVGLWNAMARYGCIMVAPILS